MFQNGKSAVKLTAAICLLCCFQGCGSDVEDEWTRKRPETYPVQGVVLYNGEPLPDALVSLNSTGANVGAAGRTDKNGEFELTTYTPGDGAVEGMHRALVIKSVVEGEDPSYFDENSPNYGRTPPPTTTRHLIPEKYAAFETSGLLVSVDASRTNRVTLELTD